MPVAHFGERSGANKLQKGVPMGQQFELPEYRAKQSKDFPEFLIVMCPRDDCPGTMADRPFLVHKRTWMRPNMLSVLDRKLETTKRIKIVGRSCPYCFRTGRVPRRIERG